MGIRCIVSAVLALLLSGVLASATGAGEPGGASGESDWLLVTLKDSFSVAEGGRLVFEHLRGDVRVKTAETDRVQVTALAQHHAEDPRKPAIRADAIDSGSLQGSLRLSIDFAKLEIAEREAWAKRRIDVGLLIPKGLEVEIETADGLIDVADAMAPARLTSLGGEISYKGSGSLTARSERGAVDVLIRQTGADQKLHLSSLTGDLSCTFLEGAEAQVSLSTRGPVTTDYSVTLERETGSPLKQGAVQIGSGGGSAVKLESHSGGIRLRALIASESRTP